MKQQNIGNKNTIFIHINQKTMTVQEFNSISEILGLSLMPSNSFLNFELSISEPFRVIGDIKLLSGIGDRYYKIFIQNGYIRNLKVIK